MVSVNLTTHVSGLASGMDTESIVNNLMKINRIPLDKLQQAKQINTWKTEAYREINTKIASFRDAMQDLRLEGTFNAQKVTSSDPRVDVSMSGTSSLQNFTISKADLATPAKPASVSFDLKIGDGTGKINPNSTGTDTISFDIINNGKTDQISIQTTNTTTFNDVITQINTKLSTTSVKASNVGGSLVFTSAAGATQHIQISNYSDPKSLLKISNGTTTDSTTFTNATSSDGADLLQGSVTINGTEIKVSSNTFTYDGVQFTLKNKIDVGSSISISAVPDTDKIFDKVKTFVDKYNELITDLNDKISEPKYRDYPPLTDAQKKDMKDDDIKLWEEKAKSGLLARDSTISQFLTEIRSSLNEEVTGATSGFDTLSDIGIKSTGTGTSWKDKGKLILDETKLKSVLNTNLSDVQKLFAKKYDTGNISDTTVTSSTKYENSGLGVRVYDRIADTLSKLTTIAGATVNSNLAKESSSLDKRIGDMQDRLNLQEQSLWAKFNAMESGLQKMNSQSSWIYQQLGM